jgi:5'-3' exonuclease
MPPGLLGPARTWRHELYPAYKANRSPPPQPVVDALPVVKALLDAMAVPWVQVTSVEADDVIATLASAATAQGLTTAIASGDKDFMQARAVRVRA